MCVCAKPLQSCLTLCDAMDCRLPDSSVHWILQARKLEWVAMPPSRGSSQPRDRTCISHTAGGFFSTEPPAKPASFPIYVYCVGQKVHSGLFVTSYGKIQRNILANTIYIYIFFLSYLNALDKDYRSIEQKYLEWKSLPCFWSCRESILFFTIRYSASYTYFHRCSLLVKSSSIFSLLRIFINNGLNCVKLFLHIFIVLIICVLEKEMATHSSVHAWRIPGTEEPGGLPSMGSHRVRHA